MIISPRILILFAADTGVFLSYSNISIIDLVL